MREGGREGDMAMGKIKILADTNLFLLSIDTTFFFLRISSIFGSDLPFLILMRMANGSDVSLYTGLSLVTYSK